MNGIGVHNNYVKKALVPMMLRAMRDGRMWCTVNVVTSTKHQEVPRDESGAPLADYSLYLKCNHVSFDRAAMVRATSLPITAEMAKHIYNTGGQSNIRDGLSPAQNLRPGNDVYNASECNASLADAEYDYYLMCPQIAELNIRQFYRIAEELKWSTEKAREEVSKYLLGKGGSDGEATFGNTFNVPEFTGTEPATMWGIKKGLKEVPFEDEAIVLKRYLAWRAESIPAAQPFALATSSRVEEVDTETNKRTSDGPDSDAKRTKKEALKD
jgi:hypothetical protein